MELSDLCKTPDQILTQDAVFTYLLEQTVQHGSFVLTVFLAGVVSAVMVKKRNGLFDFLRKFTIASFSGLMAYFAMLDWGWGSKTYAVIGACAILGEKFITFLLNRASLWSDDPQQFFKDMAYIRGKKWQEEEHPSSMITNYFQYSEPEENHIKRENRLLQEIGHRVMPSEDLEKKKRELEELRKKIEGDHV